MRILVLILSITLLNLVRALVIVPKYTLYSYLEYEELEIKLVKGSWNPVGIPYKDPIINEGDCKEKYVNTIYYWNPSEGKYEYINSIHEMKGGVGYWIYVKDDCTLRVSGVSIGIDDITLSSGWNFIAGIRTNGRYAMRQDLEKRCYVEKGPYYYDPVEGKWKIFDKLEEGKGFWIKCSPLQLDNCVFNEAKLEITCDTNCRHVEGKPTIVTVTDKKRKNMAVAIENDVKKGRIRISNGKLTFSTEPSLNMLDNDRSEWKIILVCNQPVGQAVESGVR